MRTVEPSPMRISQQLLLLIRAYHNHLLNSSVAALSSWRGASSIEFSSIWAYAPPLNHRSIRHGRAVLLTKSLHLRWAHPGMFFCRQPTLFPRWVPPFPSSVAWSMSTTFYNSSYADVLSVSCFSVFCYIVPSETCSIGNGRVVTYGCVPESLWSKIHLYLFPSDSSGWAPPASDSTWRLHFWLPNEGGRSDLSCQLHCLWNCFMKTVEINCEWILHL